MELINDILSDILPIASPSGNETGLASRFAPFMKPLVDKVTIDVFGNVIAHKNGNGMGKRVMLVAHADEVAMMVTYIDDNGFVYFQEVGAIDTNILPGQMVEIHDGDNIVYGVIGKKPLHLQDKSEYSKDWATEELWIDLGAKDKEDAERLVAVGDYITFRTQPKMLQDSLVVSKSLDDKAGIAVLMATVQSLQGKLAENDLYFVASAQEELGARGAKIATQTVKPDIAIAIDATHATDYPSVSPNKNGDIRLGSGVVITRSPNVDRDIADELIEIAQSNGIRYQVQAISHQTGTDINPIQLVEKGVRTALLGIPIRYMHTPNEVASLDDMESASKLLTQFCLSNNE